MTPYLHNLKTLFEQQASPEQAGPMKQYMRNQFEFLGIKGPMQKALVKQFIAEHGLPDLAQLDSIVRELWSWPEREYHYMALTFLDRHQKQLTPEDVPLLEYLITTKSWWDTVDSLASHNVGKLLSQYPSSRKAVIDAWRESDNIWLRRTTLLFQLGYKAQTNETLLFSLVDQNKGSKEFFIQKAIGWALREYSKTAPESVRGFVSTASLAPLSQRESLKWLKAKGQLL
ncbi:DNA alkylation repair protein [Leptolyngbya sp. CCNP1308]|uniref:DNA alkylation repair protein n=1 Tax=Leptolyngbya sp. CCNP1308 TaxID=3110255 RepID=UPI002B1F695D|nr:DNA alkylation repair protein [Leptolyngbya sp. CCNP1308]MEA5449524.1 DNA alkylation repair protein [Leptolyngbya sp. CCNP1308]